MYERELIALFVKTREPSVLKQIKNQCGMQAFTKACRRAGITQGQGNSIIGTYNDVGPIAQLAAKLGYATSKQPIY